MLRANEAVHLDEILEHRSSGTARLILRFECYCLKNHENREDMLFVQTIGKNDKILPKQPQNITKG